MNRPDPAPPTHSTGIIKSLTCLMFMMFAMTTDAVGLIIPEVIKAFDLGLTAGGAFHYATMAGVALSGLGLGFLADRWGRKNAILIGLTAFSASSLLFIVGDSFIFFLVLLFTSGLAIGVFKTAALALIGDISTSSRGHTSMMNMVEGFFGVGAIIGPAIVAWLLASGASWKGLYVVAGILAAALSITALLTRYPGTKQTAEPVDAKAIVAMTSDPFALAFSLGAMVYVGVETAIYVWMPTLLEGYSGRWAWFAAYALSIFFALRAAGRFLGAWLLGRMSWATVLVVASGGILACFGAAVLGGRASAVWSLPLSGLFMSVIYPTLNSKGISCFPKVRHGAVAGLILFFTAVSAVLSPLAMGASSDLFGGPRFGFYLAAGFAVVLFAGCLANRVWNPAEHRLARLNDSEYEDAASV
ncbi:MFS transporter [Brevundimonas sp. LM2]|uniref:MFS transporter n=1 Tax=Brevundimonas sp. LM2 TaxID=1938605 RepID=UPI000983F52B|nr:MFS transporter [Brevundimonas sp. LM2]AQR63114.1 MFS transporter [Brevundimonas sp. LM2]